MGPCELSKHLKRRLCIQSLRSRIFFEWSSFFCLDVQYLCWVSNSEVGVVVWLASVGKSYSTQRLFACSVSLPLECELFQHGNRVNRCVSSHFKRPLLARQICSCSTVTFQAFSNCPSLCNLAFRTPLLCYLSS